MSDNANPLLSGGLHLVATHGSCTIHNGDTRGNVDGEKVAEIRAWGYLTGRGALKLSSQEAVAHQDALGALFVAAPEQAQTIARLTEQNAALLAACKEANVILHYMDEVLLEIGVRSGLEIENIHHAFDTTSAAIALCEPTPALPAPLAIHTNTDFGYPDVFAEERNRGEIGLPKPEADYDWAVTCAACSQEQRIKGELPAQCPQCGANMMSEGERRRAQQLSGMMERGELMEWFCQPTAEEK